MRTVIDLTLSVLASVAAFLLSWPFWRDFEYWPESNVAWGVYFALGFALSVYVFHVFIGSLQVLFLHDTQGSNAPAVTDPSATADKGKRP